MRRVAEAHQVVGRLHRQGAHLSHLRRQADVVVPGYLQRFQVTAGVALTVLSVAVLYGWSLRSSRDRPAKRSLQPQPRSA